MRVCGRYVLAVDPSELVTEFDASLAADLFLPSYNIAPSSRIATIVGKSDSSDGRVERNIVAMTWGIHPRWAKSPSQILINARGESVAEKSTFKRAFATSRVLIPASGYYEWKRPEKTPYFIHDPEHRIMAMAGIFTTESTQQDSEATCAIITMAAAPNIEVIHDRMPAMISPDNWQAWLDPELESQAALSLLGVRTDLQARAVGSAVNSVRNNNPALLSAVGLGTTN